ncbi:MAG: hypothetical protein IPN76_29195 [Saprospiraceae bacterium]|nr:hypothetical protein [Saprospiraceae bacterium]
MRTEPPHAILVLVVLFLLLDGGYSFFQHLNAVLDGDIAPIVVPADKYEQVLHDPFGLTVLEGERYCAPNRYFVHAPMRWFFMHLPQALQAFSNPVNSVYRSSALLKTALQLALIGLLAAFAVGGNRRWELLLAAALVTPFFQAYGYNLQMGIIEKSITYTFFYPLPMAFLLAFFLPFYRGNVQRWQHLWLLPLAVALPLSGPLVPGILLIVCPFALLFFYVKNMRELTDFPIARRATKAAAEMPKPLLFYFMLVVLLSLWSLYVGSFNSESDSPAIISLTGRYPALLRGLASILTLKLGFPLLLLGIVVNLVLIRKFASAQDKAQVKLIGKWLIVFIVAYLLLLPLGGYRHYRSLIVRHDTILPVTLCLVFFYAKTAIILLRNNWPKRRWYAWGLAALSLAVTTADLPEFDHNDCEKAALETIARSSENKVKLASDCPVLGWNEKITHPNASKLNAQLLQIWRVTEEERLYYSE